MSVVLAQSVGREFVAAAPDDLKLFLPHSTGPDIGWCRRYCIESE